MVFIAGQEPEDAQGNLAGPGDLAAQARQVFANLGRALATAGTRPEQVTKITIFAVRHRPENLPVIEEARIALFGAHKPADTLVGIDTGQARVPDRGRRNRGHRWLSANPKLWAMASGPGREPARTPITRFGRDHDLHGKAVPAIQNGGSSRVPLPWSSYAPRLPRAAAGQWLRSQRPGWPGWRSSPAGVSSNTGWRSASATKASTGESLAAWKYGRAEGAMRTYR
jgi:hypothetical protein